MSNSTIARTNFTYQVPTEGNLLMDDDAFTQFVINLIKQDGEYDKDGDFYLNTKGISQTDKRLVLSYLLSAEDYEWATENNIRLEAMYSEYRSEFQKIVNFYIDDVEAEMKDNRKYNYYEEN